MVPSFRARSESLQFTVRRYWFKTDSPPHWLLGLGFRLRMTECRERGVFIGPYGGPRGGAVSHQRGSPVQGFQTYSALEATQGRMDSFSSQLPYKCYREEVASVGGCLKICPQLDSRMGDLRTLSIVLALPPPSSSSAPPASRDPSAGTDLICTT